MDTDGDGVISDAERDAAKEKRRARIVKRFDADGDGQLNDEEREAAKAAKEKYMKRRNDSVES